MSNQWFDYYKKVAGRKADPILQMAVKKLVKRKLAYDLGCGAGDDTKYLLNQGFNVIAVDKEAAAIDFINETVGKNKKFQFVVNSFEKMTFNPSQLIHGRVSFPFCHPSSFKKFWEQLNHSLEKDGLLCGSLFGVNDDWSQNNEMTFIAHEDWDALLSGYDILYFDEEERDSPTAAGHMKHWHLYYFILSKIE